jgi:uncharacterized cupin superfamily protein
VKVVNLLADEWDRIEEREGYRCRDAWIGARLGAELIGGSVYELDPGEKTWPYHLHHANEEWLIVLRGRPTLRSPEGERELVEGDTVCFPRGPAGAHQVSNHSDAVARVLILSTMLAPEMVEYPDSGKLGARDAKGERLLMIRPGPQVDYWDGEA